MAQFYEMPAVSPTMELGTLVAWRLKEGDSFESGTVVAEVGTDKANMDAEIFDDGVLIKHLIAEGDEIPPGYPIAIWGASADEDIDALLKEFEERKAAKDSAGTAPAAEASKEPAKKAPAAAESAPKPSRPAAKSVQIAPRERTWMSKKLGANFQDPQLDIQAAQGPDPKASPLAKKMAADKGIPLSRLKGTGPGDRKSVV